MACNSYGWDTPALVAYPADPGEPVADGAGESGLAIIIEHHDDQIVLRLHGELDMGTAESLRRAIRGVLRLHPQTLVLELSALGFLDCSGLSVLAWAHRQLAEGGQRLIVARGQPMVNRLLRLTGLDSYLHVSGHCPGIIR